MKDLLLRFYLEVTTTVGADISVNLNPDFDANTTIKAIINLFVVAAIITGLVAGGNMVIESLSEESPSRRRQGIYVIVGTLVIGGGVIAIVNSILA